MGETSFDFAEKVVVVTGASSGIGVALAEGFARAGANLALGARRVERLEATKAAIAQLGREAVAVPTDVVVPEDCQGLVDAAIESFGRVDVLVNNAGVGAAVPATREEPESFRQVIDVNLNGSYWMAQACGRVMESGSAIVNVGSVLGATTIGLPQAAYCSSKAAIVGLTRDLAAQWTGRKGIRVNAIAPGYFPTEMTEEYPDGFVESALERVPAGRQGTLREAAAAALFLASDSASYISGVVLPVDGGLLTN